MIETINKLNRISRQMLQEMTVESLRETVHGLLSQLTPREAKALRKLRHPSRSEQLRSFLIED